MWIIFLLNVHRITVNCTLSHFVIEAASPAKGVVNTESKTSKEGAEFDQHAVSDAKGDDTYVSPSKGEYGDVDIDGGGSPGAKEAYYDSK